ncbi:hypothetical protein L0F63_004439 [Massospora cicadina]|nr:hypothetical protein L0F63_004439 [Massospora cicadina]
MGGGFWGAVLGLLIGHMFDKARSRRQPTFLPTSKSVSRCSLPPPSRSRDRSGYSDASILMDRMNLHGESRTAAQQAFRVGKADNYPLREDASVPRRLFRMFLEIQIQAAFADGSLHPNEREVLFVIADELGISRAQFEQFLRMMQGGAQFGGGYQQQSQSGGGWQQAQRGPTLEDACNVLGVKSTDDATTIKRAYRKLMSEHHPDKLVAKGLPPEMMEMAKQKAQEIQRAYELVKEQKGIK